VWILKSAGSALLYFLPIERSNLRTEVNKVLRAKKAPASRRELFHAIKLHTTSLFFRNRF
jgi:hypothetical protein